MPADKLILRVTSVKPHYSRLASKMGKPVSGYESSLDLRGTKSNFPVRIYCDGRFGTHNNKVEFIDVSRLGLSRVTEIAKAICGSIDDALICSIDILEGPKATIFTARSCHSRPRQVADED